MKCLSFYNAKRTFFSQRKYLVIIEILIQFDFVLSDHRFSNMTISVIFDGVDEQLERLVTELEENGISVIINPFLQKKHK